MGGAVRFDGLAEIFGATGIKAAARARSAQPVEERRKRELINA